METALKQHFEQKKRHSHCRFIARFLACSCVEDDCVDFTGVETLVINMVLPCHTSSLGVTFIVVSSMASMLRVCS